MLEPGPRLEEFLLRRIHIHVGPIVKIEDALLNAVDLAALCATIVQQSRYFAAWIDRQQPKNKLDLLHSIHTICNLPWYSGFSWDALLDSFWDFSWQPAQGYLLIFRHPQTLPLGDLRTFFDIVEDVADHWAAEQKVFKLIVPQSVLVSQRVE